MIHIPKKISCHNRINETQLFSVLSQENLNKISNSSLIIKYKPDETIIKQNTKAYQTMIVLSGYVKIFVEGKEGKNLITKYGKTTDCIGISGLFTNTIYSFSVSAVEECTVCFIDYELIVEFINSNNVFANKIMRLLSLEKSNLHSKLLYLTQKQSPGRVAYSILYLKNEIFNDKIDYIIASRNEIADLNGITKDNAGRILKDFNDNGIIKFDGKHIKVLDISKLEQIRDFG